MSSLVSIPSSYRPKPFLTFFLPTLPLRIHSRVLLEQSTLLLRRREQNVTLDDTSPLIRYTPVVTASSVADATTGWSSFCNAVASEYRCDEHSAHSTGMDGATFALSFWGTSITLYGNVTLEMNFTVQVDGLEKGIAPGSGADGQTLAVVQGLGEAQHTLVVTAKKGTIQSLLVFDKAEVVLGSATSVTKQYVAGSNSSIIYGPQPGAPWSAPNTYIGTITPPGINDTQFDASRTLGATFYYKFQGTAFFWYGPCYTDTHAYTVVLDGTANSQPQQFNASVPYIQIIEGCLRYYAAGLSSTGPMHEFLATNAENHWMTLDWLEVWNYQVNPANGVGVGTGEGGGGGGTGSSSNGVGLSSSSSTFALFIVLYSLLFHLL